jgi:DNA replication and repair protein RecF
MWIEHIRLKNVRNFDALELHLGPGIHFFQGSNGAGKTNLLEAVAFLLSGHSFRTHRLTDLMRHDQEEMVLEVSLMCRLHRYELLMRVGPQGKKLWIGKKTCRDWTGLFPVATWVPEDIEVIKGGPSARRAFLDHHLIHVDPLYQHHLHRYQKALEQRSLLLKRGKEEGIEAYEKQMALSGAYLMQARHLAINDLNSYFKSKLLELELEGDHRLVYQPATHERSLASLELMWKHSRAQEYKAKQTLKGPHLEDFQILFQGKDARRFASEGQARACIACLKAAEWHRLSGFEGQALLLIDEIGMGLDAKRWEKIWSWISGWQQALVTSPYERYLDGSKPLKRWQVKEAKISSFTQAASNS